MANVAPNRKSIKDVDISPEERLALYADSGSLPVSFRRKAGLALPFAAYFQDPFVAKQDPSTGIDDQVFVAWEPGLSDGPTSSRLAVVDYNADTGKLEPPAVWNDDAQAYAGTDKAVLGADNRASFQFHQVSLWATLQRALEFFEEGSALGRPIPWAFEGNRLIVVPHAGYGENAFYDRESKSLQFYYFGDETAPVYTCLSVDIINHEFAHAVLDGIRPLLSESSNPQTAAFHEFVGDLSAILLTLQNGKMRRALAASSKGKFENATTLSSLAEEFGNAVSGRPYLRTARNKSTMAEMAGETEPHRLSEVLTGAMFDVLIAIGENYQKIDGARASKTAPEAFWYAAERMQRMAIQPFDLLPPVEVTFRDYALAVCRAERLADPLDPENYYGMLIDCFCKRGIFSTEDADALKEPRYLTDRLNLSVRHNIDGISRSRAAAYRFLDDNREHLLIPAGRDFFVADLYDARKRGRQNQPLPRQIVLEYGWREEVMLDGARFGPLAGKLTSMLCGGTIVLDESGNVLSWMMKPGSREYGGKRASTGKVADRWTRASAEGTARRTALLDGIAAHVAAGSIGTAVGSANGLLASMMPPVIAEGDGDMVRFRLPPHLRLSEDKDQERTGARQWQISC